MYDNHVGLPEALDFFARYEPVSASYNEQADTFEIRTIDAQCDHSSGIPVELSRNNLVGISAEMKRREARGTKLSSAHQALSAFCRKILDAHPPKESAGHRSWVSRSSLQERAPAP